MGDTKIDQKEGCVDGGGGWRRGWATGLRATSGKMTDWRARVSVG